MGAAIYAVGAIALVIIGLLLLLLRRRDSRVATIKSLPSYGTPDAAALQRAIATQGPVRLLSPSDEATSLVEIEPARSEASFREQMTIGDRSPNSPAVRWRRARTKPVRPKPLTAPRARPGFAPSREILVQAVRCRICSRPLTNNESRRRGVGPDCYRKYGARVVHAPNPAFAEWAARRTLIETQQAAWQALLDELYKQLMERFEAEMRNWSAAGGAAA